LTVPHIEENLTAVVAYDSVDSLAYPQTEVNLGAILFFRIGLLHDNICEVKEMFVGYQLILLS
jgi:hypothetical protein